MKKWKREKTKDHQNEIKENLLTNCYTYEVKLLLITTKRMNNNLFKSLATQEKKMIFPLFNFIIDSVISEGIWLADGKER